MGCKLAKVWINKMKNSWVELSSEQKKKRKYFYNKELHASQIKSKFKVTLLKNFKSQFYGNKFKMIN